MNWQDRIVSDTDTLFGGPRIKGRRIGIDFVLELLASGWNEAQILEDYPHLKAEDLQAVCLRATHDLKPEPSVRDTHTTN